MDIKTAADIVNELGVAGVLLVVIGGLVWWLRHQTMPKEAYELLHERVGAQEDEIHELRYEVKETIGPAVARIADIQQRQYEVMQETLHHVSQLENRIDEYHRLEAPYAGWRSRKDE